MSTPEPNKARFGSYRNALKLISVRTGAPLPSLIVSFAVLHELTAIVPIIGIFYGARMLGVGERIVTVAIEDNPDSAFPRGGWVREKCKNWVDEGELWAGRVGRRYGFFGFEKGKSTTGDVGNKNHRLSGDVANAVLAYALTKVIVISQGNKLRADALLNDRHYFPCA